MCGITGYAGWNGGALLESMVQAIRHRGPDDQALERYEGAGLGFARLAIIDLSGGRQPLSSSDGKIHVVVNGEIYNHQLLRKELGTLGHDFSTQSDSEALLHAYEEWGFAAIPRMEGMFAAAIWDDNIQTLTLARDRLGKKPLYWMPVDGGVAFASEVKALLAATGQQRLSPKSTLLYLVSDSVPTPHSMWSEVSKLPAGGILKWDPNSGVKTSSFWPAESLGQGFSVSTDWESRLESKIRSAVKERLMSDVPVGVFLSAGVDSMLVAAVARAQTSDEIHSYTLRFEDSSYDESAGARDFAQSLGLVHHEVPVGLGEMVDAVDRLVEVFDEPVNDPACLVMLRLAQVASNDIKVALTGDGGDELFLGYRHLRMHEVFEKFPQGIHRMLKHVRHPMGAVPDSGGYFSAGFKAQRLARGFGHTGLVERDLAWRGSFESHKALAFLDRDFAGSLIESDALDHFVGVFSESPVGAQGLEGWSWLYLRTYLLDTVLVKVDRASMAFGVEARSPLLDRQVVELVLQMPLASKTGAFRNKRLLRSLLERTSPGAQPARVKHGMGVPVRQLLLGPLNARLHHVATPAFLRRQGIFSPEAVASLIADFEGGRKDTRKEVWGFFMYQLWFERWGGFSTQAQLRKNQVL